MGFFDGGKNHRSLTPSPQKNGGLEDDSFAGWGESDVSGGELLHFGG